MGSLCSSSTGEKSGEIQCPQKLAFLEIINSKPDFSKYERDKTLVETIENAWESEVYGMSVLQPIRKPAKDESTLIPNVLS